MCLKIIIYLAFFSCQNNYNFRLLLHIIFFTIIPLFIEFIQLTSPLITINKDISINNINFTIKINIINHFFKIHA